MSPDSSSIRDEGALVSTERTISLSIGICSSAIRNASRSRAFPEPKLRRPIVLSRSRTSVRACRNFSSAEAFSIQACTTSWRWRIGKQVRVDQGARHRRAQDNTHAQPNGQSDNFNIDPVARTDHKLQQLSIVTGQYQIQSYRPSPMTPAEMERKSRELKRVLGVLRLRFCRKSKCYGGCRLPNSSRRSWVMTAFCDRENSSDGRQHVYSDANWIAYRHSAAIGRLPFAPAYRIRSRRIVPVVSFTHIVPAFAARSIDAMVKI